MLAYQLYSINIVHRCTTAWLVNFVEAFKVGLLETYLLFSKPQHKIQKEF